MTHEDLQQRLIEKLSKVVGDYVDNLSKSNRRRMMMSNDDDPRRTPLKATF